ncbi:MAG: TlpA family protein disulfide reductase [Parvularculaceae bacterium]
MAALDKFRGIFLLAAFVAALGIAVAVKAPAPDVAQKSAGKASVVAASFTSAWCAACRILEPRLADAMSAFSDRAVEFVDFDFTFGDTLALADLAKAHDLSRLYEANKGATGFTVLVDANTGEIIDTLTMNFSPGDIRAAIERALAIATHTEDAAGARD